MAVKDSARRAGQVAVRSLALAGDRLRPPARGVSVLIYHRVGARSSMAVDLPRGQFDEQVAALAAAGRACPLDEALVIVGTKASVGDRVALTFDDGTVDWVTDVLPVLAHHHVPATFYVATDFVERGVAFPHDGTPISWDGLRELVASGLATIGSHTHTHALLDRAPDAVIREELDRSKGLIEDRLGVACEHFAYPKALMGSAVARAEVRARFRSAAIAGNRPNPFGATDVYALARTPIQRSDDARWFQHKIDTGLRLEDGVRRLLNRRRYAGATT